jgi:hypothetical protein
MLCDVRTTTDLTDTLGLTAEGERCPACSHPDIGTVSRVEAIARAMLRLRPARPHCPADDGMGGDLAYDGTCRCEDAFHR